MQTLLTSIMCGAKCNLPQVVLSVGKSLFVAGGKVVNSTVAAGDYSVAYFEVQEGGTVGDFVKNWAAFLLGVPTSQYVLNVRSKVGVVSIIIIIIIIRAIFVRRQGWGGYCRARVAVGEESQCSCLRGIFVVLLRTPWTFQLQY